MKIEPLDNGHPYPVLVTAPDRAGDASEWAASNREAINALLLKHGALLFRGLEVKASKDFERFSGALIERPWTGNPNVYTMRHQVQGAVYTSTDYPETQNLTQHCEFSHSPFRKWPMKLFFFCELSAQEGGETPIADARRVFHRIPAEIRSAFLTKHLHYRRIFYEGEVPWSQVFQTEDPAVVERYCHEHDLRFEWRNGGRDLRLEWTLHAAAKHPVTSEELWFNQAHTVAFSAISPEMQKYFLDKYGYEDRPVDCTFADGTAIPETFITTIQKAFEDESSLFPWRSGDVLLLDNMMMSHGRRAFRGPRRVLVAMGNEANTRNVKTL